MGIPLYRPVSVNQRGGGAGEAGLGSYPTTTAKTRSTTATWNCPKPCGAVMGRVDATPVAALQDAANNAHIMHMSQHTLGIHNPPEIIYLGNIIWGVTELISLLSKREAIGAKGGGRTPALGWVMKTADYHDPTPFPEIFVFFSRERLDPGLPNHLCLTSNSPSGTSYSADKGLNRVGLATPPHPVLTPSFH